MEFGVYVLFVLFVLFVRISLPGVCAHLEEKRHVDHQRPHRPQNEADNAIGHR